MRGMKFELHGVQGVQEFGILNRSAHSAIEQQQEHRRDGPVREQQQGAEQADGGNRPAIAHHFNAFEHEA